MDDVRRGMIVQLRGGDPRRYTVLEVQDSQSGEQCVHLRGEMISGDFSEIDGTPTQGYTDNCLERWADVNQLVGFSEPRGEAVVPAMPPAPVPPDVPPPMASTPVPRGVPHGA